MRHQDLLAGFVRLHVLAHAVRAEVWGAWMIEELARHGYQLSPGTLYPMLHAMEKRGYLTCRVERLGKTARKLYRATLLGEEGLEEARRRLGELWGEVGSRGSD